MLFDAETALTGRVVSSDFVSKLAFLKYASCICVLMGGLERIFFIYVILGLTSEDFNIVLTCILFFNYIYS